MRKLYQLSLNDRTNYLRAIALIAVCYLLFVARQRLPLRIDIVLKQQRRDLSASPFTKLYGMKLYLEKTAA